MSFKKKIVPLLFLIICLAPFFFVSGESPAGFDLEVTWPRAPLPVEGEYIQPNEGIRLHELAAYFYSWGVGIAALLAFGMLIFAGINYITAAGDPQKISETTEKITKTLLGLILVLSSFIVLNIINPQLTEMRPVEDLLREMDFEIRGIDISVMEEPACEFVLLYSGEEFTGRETIRLVDTEEATPHVVNSIKGYRQMTGTEIDNYRSDEIGDALREIRGEIGKMEEFDNLQEILQEAEEVSSINSFGDLDVFLEYAREEAFFDEEKILRWENMSKNPDFPNRSPEGRDIRKEEGNYYIQGNSCLVTPYKASSTLWGTHLCGKDLGVIFVPSLGVRNEDEVRRDFFPGKKEEDISCLYIENIGKDSWGGGIGDIETPPALELGEWVCGGLDPEADYANPCSEEGVSVVEDEEKWEPFCGLPPPPDLSQYPSVAEKVLDIKSPLEYETYEGDGIVYNSEEGFFVEDLREFYEIVGVTDLPGVESKADYLVQKGHFKCPIIKEEETYLPFMGLWCCYAKAPTGVPYGSPVKNGTITAPFGGNHIGIDIASGEGAPIYATAAGQVSLVATDNNRGLHVRIDHGEGYVTQYVHLLNTSVVVGDYIKRGQQIGGMGGRPSGGTRNAVLNWLSQGRPRPPGCPGAASGAPLSIAAGCSTGVHLHYDVIKNGVHQNTNLTKYGVCGNLPCTSGQTTGPVASD